MYVYTQKTKTKTKHNKLEDQNRDLNCENKQISEVRRTRQKGGGGAKKGGKKKKGKKGFRGADVRGGK